MEKLKKRDPTSIDKIKGCIIDSAPVDAPDPQVNNLFISEFPFYADYWIYLLTTFFLLFFLFKFYLL